MIAALSDVRKYSRKGDALVKALDGVSFVVHAGEFSAVMGPSGSGKSTLMNLVGALDRPTSGNVALEGRDLSGLPDYELSRLRNRYVGFVFQSYNLLPELTAQENVALPMYYAGVRKRERMAKAAGLLAQVGLGERASHYPSELSGGEEQRVAIARALANDPVMILADEPTGNLNRGTRDQVMGLLTELNRKGTAVVVVSHDPAVADYAHRVVRLRDGRLAEA